MSEILHDRVSWTVTDRIARITLIRGAGNALDMAAAKGLREAADRVTHGAVDGSVRVAVIAAEGPTFCVGGDLREFATAPDRGPHVAAVAAELHQAILTFTRAPIPVVSVVHGTVAGGGIGLALAADIVLMADDAAMRLAYTAVGLTPDCGSTWALAHRLGPARALDLALTNRTLTGTEAAAWGLISRAVPAAELADVAAQVVAVLRSGSPIAFAETKRLVTAAAGRDLPAQLDDEAATIAQVIDRPDGLAGIQAFLDKRTPSFG